MRSKSARLHGAWLALLAGIVLSAPCAASWRVSEARIVLGVALDGSMLVRETLTVASDAHHGTPYRDLPLALTADRPPSFDIDVMQVSQAGQRLPWQTEAKDRALRVHLGSPRRRIPPGVQVYELLYHVDGHLAAGGGREWLLWRPVGAGVAARVSSLHVTVTFPRALNAGEMRVEVAGGAMERHLDADGTVRIDSAAVIAAGRGPALLVGWPRGHLLTATDSEIDPWMQPRLTSLWFGVAGLLLLAIGLRLAGSPAPGRGFLPACAAAVSLATLYAAGVPAARAETAFPAEFVLAVSGATFAALARHWLRGAALRIAYIVVVTAIAATVTVRWTVNISPWYPLLVLLHADLLLLVRWRTSRPARPATRGARAGRGHPPASRPATPAAAPVPVLDHEANRPDRVGELLPDGRRVPYFDTAGDEPSQSSSGRW